MEFHLVSNQTENDNYNPDFVWINKILKMFLCVSTDQCVNSTGAFHSASEMGELERGAFLIFL